MKKALLATAVTMAMTSAAYAEVRINGFANFTGGITNQETNALGYNDNVELSEDSLFAIQLSAPISDQLSATAQIISRGSDDYSAEFEWAYLQYTVDDNSTVVVGRFRLPMFTYSDSLDVAYSYHWIEAPSSVYDVAFNNLNGVRYDYTTFAGDWELLFRASAGNYNEDISGGEIEGRHLLIGSIEANYDAFKFRAVLGRGESTFNQPALDATLTEFESFSPELADSLRLEEDSGTFIGLGLNYDNFDWFVGAEATRVETEDSFSPEDTAWYVTGGIRLGKWTPHLTYETRDGNDDPKFLDAVAGFPAELQPTVEGSVIGLQRQFIEDYSVVTLGLRYDYMPSLALKAEVSRYDNKLDRGTGIRGDSVDTTLVRLAVNYVF